MASLIPTVSRGLLANSNGSYLTVAAMTDAYVPSEADGYLTALAGEVTAPGYARVDRGATWDPVTGTLHVTGDAVTFNLAGASVGALVFAEKYGSPAGRIVAIVDWDGPVAGYNAMRFDLPDGIAGVADTGTVTARVDVLDGRVTALEAAPPSTAPEAAPPSSGGGGAGLPNPTGASPGSFLVTNAGSTGYEVSYYDQESLDLHGVGLAVLNTTGAAPGNVLTVPAAPGGPASWAPPTGGGGGGVQSVVAGANVTVNNTDPARPIISATGGGGTGGVASVNGDVGPAVVLTPASISAATAAQGGKADTAVQPGALAAVATAGTYTSLTGRPALGTAAAKNIGDFATPAQGTLAGTAVQPAALAAGLAPKADLTDPRFTDARTPVAHDQPWSSITGKPALATAAQGVKADSAVQPGDARMAPSPVGQPDGAAVTVVGGAYTLARPEPGPYIPGGTFVPFGDSFVDVSGTQTYNDNTNRAASGAVMWMELYARGRLRPLGNAGKNGNTTTQMLARLQAEVINLKPNLCVLLTAGVNDLAQSVPTATTTSNLSSMFDRMTAAGILCVTATVTPATAVNTVAKQKLLFSLNRWLLDEAARRPGLVVVDLYSQVADPSAVAWLPGLSNDGTHPSVRGSEVLGRHLALAIDKLIPSTGSRIGHGGDPFELLPNPSMVGADGGVRAFSTLITGGAGVASKVPRTDQPGEWQRWAATSGTSRIYQEATGGFVAGDRVVARWELRTSDMGAATGLHVVVEAYPATGAASRALYVLMSATGDVPAPGLVVAESNALVVPADTTRLRSVVRIDGGGTVDIGSMSLRLADT